MVFINFICKVEFSGFILPPRKLAKIIKALQRLNVSLNNSATSNTEKGSRGEGAEETACRHFQGEKGP